MSFNTPIDRRNTNSTKWDLMEKDNSSVKKFTDYIETKIAPFNDVPIVFTSVHEKQRVFKIFQILLIECRMQ